ncbi:MAG: coproporphyrinogen-III oxidase family protein [Spirochaetota bacterium]
MNTLNRYRSHHDSQAALARALGVERTHGQGASVTLEDLLRGTTPTRPRGLYLHVPFCDHICSFCNMNRCLSDTGALEAYSAEVVAQLRSAGEFDYVTSRPFDAVYFGGGTPTALLPAGLEAVLSQLVRSIPRDPACEWTVESTIHNLTPGKLSLLADAGVNRLSIGVQTFSDRGRRLLGRAGTGAWAARALEAVRREFDGTLGIDLIYSYPGQTLDEVREDAAMVGRLGIDSVSVYSLMIHDGSELSTRIADGELSFERSIDSDRRNHNELVDALAGHGLELLELTKMARPGRDDYRYIRIRYENADLLPVGTGAGGRIGSHRVYRVSPERTMISPTAPRYDELNLVLGYLQFGRYDVDALVELCGEPARETILSALREFHASGLLTPLGPGDYRLTPDGMFWGNNMAVDLLERIVTPLASEMNAPVR